ncbi:hypothetical protein EXIGLDRAFT_660968, partial [Exidia glandulosa HHB12029]
MNYTSYETAIVGTYSVRLVGWTYGDKIVNPGQIGSVDDLRALHEALVKKTCRWESVSDEERDAIVTAAPKKQRKERCDKNEKRAPYKKRATAADKENEVQDAAKKATK